VAVASGHACCGAWPALGAAWQDGACGVQRRNRWTAAGGISAARDNLCVIVILRLDLHGLRSAQNHRCCQTGCH
jgi:hypothetical protein